MRTSSQDQSLFGEGATACLRGCRFMWLPIGSVMPTQPSLALLSHIVEQSKQQEGAGTRWRGDILTCLNRSEVWAL